MRRTQANQTPAASLLARSPRAFSPLPAGARCAICGFNDPMWLHTARVGTERAVLCADSECRQCWEASHPTLLLETLAILAARTDRVA